MKKLLSFLQSSGFRTAFMVIAVAAGVWAVITQWDEFVAGLTRLTWWQTALAIIASFAYVYMTMLSWRHLLNGLGKPLPGRATGTIFFTSQVAKYLPGGVWNFVAAAEAGVAHEVSRRRSITVLMTSMLVSILTGMVFAVLTLLVGPGGIRSSYGWMALFLPVLVVLLLPPVLNRVIAVVLRILKREPLEKDLSWRRLGAAIAWSLGAWAVAGFQVWLMLTAMGMEATVGTFLLATGGYALAWTVGFLVVFIPAGIGVREVVLGAVLSGYLAQGSVLAVILLSRVFLTTADLGWGIGASLLAGRGRAASAFQPDIANHSEGH
jgi:uncharacterized membrane protein YbhN (UPF0104 family)